jgi:CRP/FNR family cyclic AMP-dependent transcriptional regulator
VNQNSPNLPNLLKTAVPLFQNFTEEEILTVISICEMRPFVEGEILVESGSESDEMMLILSGTLLVKTANDTPLAQLFCPDTIGEMGMLTGARRSATIEGVEKGRVAVLPKASLMQVLDDHTDMAVRFYKNVFEVLAVRLRNENFLIETLREQVEELEDQLNVKEADSSIKGSQDSVPEDDLDVVAAFYRQIGNPDLSGVQKNRDQVAYAALRRKGYSDEQARRTATWAAQNVRGVKAFALVKHCVQEALKEEDS